MDDKKGNQVLLAVVGIATLLVAVIGATFAFFTAAGISGNATDANVITNTATYGDTRVVYEDDNKIQTGEVNLLEENALETMTWNMRFYVETSSTIAQNITINWKDVENNFARRTDNNFIEIVAGTCSGGGHTTEATCVNANQSWTPDPSATTDVAAEVTYTLYNCDSAGYSNNVWTSFDGTSRDETELGALTIPATCTKLSGETDPAIPLQGSTGKLHITDDFALAASPDGTVRANTYFVLTLTFHNLDRVQNYNQSKSFEGTIDVQLAVEAAPAEPGE